MQASTLSKITAGEPVLVKVAAILRPTLPDLPMPTMTILPALFQRSTIASTAALKDLSSNCAGRLPGRPVQCRKLAGLWPGGSQRRLPATAEDFNREADSLQFAAGGNCWVTRGPAVCCRRGCGRTSVRAVAWRNGVASTGHFAREPVEIADGHFQQMAVHVGNDIRRAGALIEQGHVPEKSPGRMWPGWFPAADHGPAPAIRRSCTRYMRVARFALPDTPRSHCNTSAGIAGNPRECASCVSLHVGENFDAAQGARFELAGAGVRSVAQVSGSEIFLQFRPEFSHFCQRQACSLLRENPASRQRPVHP